MEIQMVKQMPMVKLILMAIEKEIRKQKD